MNVHGRNQQTQEVRKKKTTMLAKATGERQHGSTMEPAAGHLCGGDARRGETWGGMGGGGALRDHPESPAVVESGETEPGAAEWPAAPLEAVCSPARRF